MIDKFEGKYYFLSNFYSCKFYYDGILYNNSEAAFQAQKNDSIAIRYLYSDANPSVAKKMGRNCVLRSDWEKVKDKIMYEVVKAKFEQNEDLKKLLLSTKDEQLVEGTTWHDNYWGNCTCDRCASIKGKNQLGKTLMKIREEFKNEK